MAKITQEDAFQISSKLLKDAIPHMENMLDDVFKEYPIDIEVRKAILHSVLVAHKLSVETTVSLIAELLNSQES